MRFNASMSVAPVRRIADDYHHSTAEDNKENGEEVHIEHDPTLSEHDNLFRSWLRIDGLWLNSQYQTLG